VEGIGIFSRFSYLASCSSEISVSLPNDAICFQIITLESYFNVLGHLGHSPKC